MSKYYFMLEYKHRIKSSSKQTPFFILWLTFIINTSKTTFLLQF